MEDPESRANCSDDLIKQQSSEINSPLPYITIYLNLSFKHLSIYLSIYLDFRILWRIGCYTAHRYLNSDRLQKCIVIYIVLGTRPVSKNSGHKYCGDWLELIAKTCDYTAKAYDSASAQRRHCRKEYKNEHLQDRAWWAAVAPSRTYAGTGQCTAAAAQVLSRNTREGVAERAGGSSWNVRWSRRQPWTWLIVTVLGWRKYVKKTNKQIFTLDKRSWD